MTKATLKKKIYQVVNYTKDDEVLEIVYAILKRTVSEVPAKEIKSKDFWDELSKEQHLLIEKAIKDANQGKLTSHVEVMKKLRKK